MFHVQSTDVLSQSQLTLGLGGVARAQSEPVSNFTILSTSGMIVVCALTTTLVTRVSCRSEKSAMAVWVRSYLQKTLQIFAAPWNFAVVGLWIFWKNGVER